MDDQRGGLIEGLVAPAPVPVVVPGLQPSGELLHRLVRERFETRFDLLRRYVYGLLILTGVQYSKCYVIPVVNVSSAVSYQPR